MFITCQKCNTNFIIKPNQIGNDGRKVKCSKCHHTWHHKIESILEKKLDDKLLIPIPRENELKFGINAAELNDSNNNLNNNLFKNFSDTISDNIPKGINLPAKIPVKHYNKLFSKHSVLFLITLTLLLCNLALSYYIINYNSYQSLTKNFDLIEIKQIDILQDIDKENCNVRYQLYNSSDYEIKVPVIAMQLLDENQQIINSHIDYWEELKIPPNSVINITTNFYKTIGNARYADITFGNKFYFFIQKIISN